MTIRILVMAGPRHLPVLGAMLENLKRHWRPLPPVEILGEQRTPVPPWVGWNEDFATAAGAFSNRLRVALFGVEEPITYLTPCDAFLLNDLDAIQMAGLATYILKHEDVARVAVVEPIEPAERVGLMWRGMEIVCCAEWRHCSIQAGMSMAPGLWHRDRLRTLLEPGWTVWEIEQRGSYRMRDRFPELRSVGVRPPLARHVDVSSREAQRSYLERLPWEDRQGIEEGFDAWRS